MRNPASICVTLAELREGLFGLEVTPMDDVVREGVLRQGLIPRPVKTCLLTTCNRSFSA